MARVIAAKAQLRNEIVRYNNSQNAIKIWTVRAADDVQQELRREFDLEKIDYAPKQQGSRKTKKASTIELDRVAQYLASSEKAFILQAIDNKSELFDQPYQKLFRRGIKAPEVYLAWLIGSAADIERKELHTALGKDDNSGLLSVTSAHWIVYCSYKLIEEFTKLNISQITLQKMKSAEFSSAIKKYAKEAATLFYDAAVDTYDRDEFGSIKSTLRSSKFLTKMDSKINSKIARLRKNILPDLVTVCKSLKKGA